MQLQILKRQELTGIPSASGIETYKGFYYIVGDNSPWLFKLDASFKTLEKILIAPDTGLIDEQIPKKDKPDFEAMTLVKDGNDHELLIFGSGSKLANRYGLVCVSPDHGHRVINYSLYELYKAIRKTIDLAEGDFNIEAAAASDTHLYLFNRGKNRLITFLLADFLNYIKHGSEIPSFTFTKIRLPKIDNLKSGFSGATLTKDNKYLIFTASVENTSDWVDDGAILGSFIGLLPVAELHKGYEAECVLVSENSTTLGLKVESVTLNLQQTAPGLCLVLVTDSDGAASEILEARLSV